MGKLIIAVSVLFALCGIAHADEGGGWDGTYITPQPADTEQPRIWWNEVDESIRPAEDKVSGRWKISVDLFDETDRLLSESEILVLENYPARISVQRLGGREVGGQGGSLADYPFVMWVVPDALLPAFQAEGWRDWPAARKPVTDTGGTAVPSEFFPLTDGQKQQLFSEALAQAHEVSLDGLHLYIVSTQASRAELKLDWEDIQIPGNPLVERDGKLFSSAQLSVEFP